MTTFNQRMTLLLDKIGGPALSAGTGISRTQLHRLKEDGRETTRENLLNICSTTGVNLIWLMTGEGPMYSDGTPDLAIPKTPIPEFSKDELEMLALFRNAPLMQKMQVVQMLSGEQEK